MKGLRCSSETLFQGRLGSSVVLRCPVGELRSNTSNFNWYQEQSIGKRVSVASMTILNYRVINNKTLGKRKRDMWFGSTDGDLYIQNLRWGDGGIYGCHFTGFKEKTVQLSVKGMVILPPQLPVLVDKLWNMGASPVLFSGVNRIVNVK